MQFTDAISNCGEFTDTYITKRPSLKAVNRKGLPLLHKREDMPYKTRSRKKFRKTKNTRIREKYVKKLDSKPIPWVWNTEWQKKILCIAVISIASF